jgi:ankyrin repeat protein
MTLNVYKGGQELEFQDLVTGIIFFDATSAAVGMTFSGKQTLSSRIFVIANSVLQACTLGAIAITMSRVPHFNPPAYSCAPQIFWWGVIESGKPLPASFWLYFCLRLTSSLHNTWLALKFSTTFDMLEKAHRGLKVPALKPASSDPVVSIELRSQEDGSIDNADREVAKTSYNRISATALSAYLEYVPMMVACAHGIENFMNREHTGKIEEWGQSAAVATCAVTVVHLVYTYTSLFSSASASTRNQIRADLGLETDASTGTQKCPSTLVSLHQIWAYLYHRSPFYRNQAKSLDFVRHAHPNDWHLVHLDIAKEEIQRQNGLLVQAVKTHDSKLLVMSLEAGASPNAKQEDGSLVLVLATQWSSMFAIGILLDAGADIEATSKEDGTALMKASAEGHGSAVELLLTRNANVNAQGGIYGSALHAASWEQHINIVELLLRNGADVNAAISSHHQLLRGINRNSPQKAPVTALQVASFRGHFKIVESMLSKGALNKGYGGNLADSALHVASARGHYEIVDLFLDKGFDINTMNISGNTALAVASARGYSKAAKFLLDKGADINLTNNWGSTALHAASCGGHSEVVKLLLNKGADVNTACSSGWTVLFSASVMGSLEVVAMLLNKGADTNLANDSGSTALYNAVEHGYPKVVKMLLNKGADINATDNSGRTALLAASRRGNYEIVKILLENGANISTADDLGCTPLKAAMDNYDSEAMELLTRAVNGVRIASVRSDPYQDLRSMKAWQRRIVNLPEEE